MGRYQYSDEEKKLNKILKHQDDEIEKIKESRIDTESLDQSIDSSEELLKSLGYSTDNVIAMPEKVEKKIIEVPAWDELCALAEREYADDVELEDLFTVDELKENTEAVRKINRNFRSMYNMDQCDYIIAGIAGTVGSAIELAVNLKKDKIIEKLKKIENKTEVIQKKVEDIKELPLVKKLMEQESLKNNVLANFFDVEQFDCKQFFEKIIEYLKREPQKIEVAKPSENALFALAKGETPLNSFFVEANKIINDQNEKEDLPKMGVKLVDLVCEYTNLDREQLVDVLTEFYNKEKEVLDFSDKSLSVAIIETIVRLGSIVKSLIKSQAVNADAIDFFESHKDEFIEFKLTNMLMISHSVSTLANLGEIVITRNSKLVDYMQWKTMGLYAYKELKFAVIDKPELLDDYFEGKIGPLLQEVYNDTDRLVNRMSDRYEIVLK